MPLAVAPTVRLGASAWSATVTVLVPLVESVLVPPSFSVYVTLRVQHSFPTRRSSDLRADSVQLLTSIAAPVLVTVCVPSLRTTPAGTPAMVVDRDRKRTRLDSSHTVMPSPSSIAK